MSAPTGLKVALALNAGALLAVAAIAVHLGGGFAPVSFPPDEALPRAAAPALAPTGAGAVDDADRAATDTASDALRDARAATAAHADAPRVDAAPPYPSFATPDLSARPWLTRADGSVRLRD
ncbi:hypothetical protein [Derxia gummosa]|uniref:Uncharacterized protein n=1 Tax=Derxia gummosa DSM 723 TaxID=1121388 RepID=A0A8B6X597_9BURK|nr:hypothetical protein [Derxia gummosa]